MDYRGIMLKSNLPLLFLHTLLSGCVVTGPADDGYENSNEWVDNRRLLDTETKTAYSSLQRQADQTANQSEPNTSSMSESDYAAYQHWQQAKDNDSPVYQKFKQWQEYEAFQRWKQQQDSE